MQDSVQILLITGAAGVGKSTLCWEISAQLAEAGVAHAALESDELDRVFPKPTAAQMERLGPGTTDISALTLAGIWAPYRALGIRRLIMSGVMLHPQFDRRWILSAIPEAEITIVRLLASDETLMERLVGREIGSGAAAQAERTLRQARRLASEAPGTSLRVETDDRGPIELARSILQQVGWTN